MMLTNEHVYVLWVERQANPAEQPLNGRIEHVATGHRVAFETEEALLDFLKRWPPNDGEAAGHDSPPIRSGEP